MELRIGCTGWSYDGWIGPFYPKNLPNSEHLKHYSSVFDTTEINSTFYRIPSISMAKKWAQDTPEIFKFTAKLPKIITHDNRLKPTPYLDQFLQSIKPLESKLSIIVIQLPPSLSFEEAKPQLEKITNHMPKNYRYAVEGRHKTWFTDNAYRFLSEKHLCLVWNEVEGVENPAPLTTDFVYLRLIGDRTIPENEFGKISKDRTDLIKKWVDKLDKAKNKVSMAVVMANNRFEGFGPVTANKLRLLMGLPEASWYDKNQKALSDF